MRGRVRGRSIALLLLLSTAACSTAAIPPVATVQSGTAAQKLDSRSYERAEAVLPQNVRSLIRQISVRPQWIGEGATFWFEREREAGRDYVRVDAATGESKPLFDHDALIAALAQATGSQIERTSFKLDGLRYDEKDKRFGFTFAERQWTLDPETGALNEKTGDEAKGVLSPDGAWRVVVRGHDLYLVSVKTGAEKRLTRDGSATRPYARPVVNVKTMIAKGSSAPELEPDISWSPDSRRFVTYRMDLTRARHLSLVQSTPADGSPPRVFDYAYPFTGDGETATATSLIFDAASGTSVTVEMPAEEMLYYGGPWFEWNKAGDALFRQIQTRGYKAMRLLRIDAATGKARVLAEDRSDTYVDYYGHFWDYDKASDTHFWTADPTGYAHVYAIDGTSGARRQLTSGEWRARSVAGVDREGGALLVVGSGREAGRDPYLRSLYRVALDGGALTPLTPEPLDHDVSVSPDGRFFVDNMSLINQPTRSVLRRASDGEIVMELGRADASAYLAAGYSFPEPFETVAADGKTPIYGAIWRPADFDPKRKYPVIEDIYTGPHYVMTPKSFEASFRTSVNSMAQLGFFGVTIDGRGTWGRSRSFQQPAYQNLHLVGLDDHVAGIKAMGARYPSMDLERVGIFGFSAGGYDVMRALTRRPDFYKAGVSASGNHDNRLDKAVWNEQWMGSDLGSIYDENSNVTWAKALQGRLFLAHGELDENVPPAATLRLVDALIAANKDFEFLIVPNADHFLDDSPYFQRRRWDFFLRALGDGEPPAGYRIKPFARK